MRGIGHGDPIETVTFKHEEGNEGKKIGVKRGIAAFYGGKLLKRQGRRRAAHPKFWALNRATVCRLSESSLLPM